MATQKRTYKDSVFTDLFSSDVGAKKRFLELYNALFGAKLENIEALKNVKLGQPLYTGFVNDVSYLVEGKLVILIEHQSSICENIPLRCLAYIAKTYQKIIELYKWYKRKRLELPTPSFFVFYNGIEKHDLESDLRLSDAFMEKLENPFLELVVKVININTEAKHELLEKSQSLKDYSILVKMVQDYTERDKTKGFDEALAECLKLGILPGYLDRKTQEVKNMLFAEYDYETDIAVRREEALEEGRKEGIALGEKRGRQEGAYQKAVETAKNLKRMNLPIVQISQATGLSIEEIEKIE